MSQDQLKIHFAGLKNQAKRKLGFRVEDKVDIEEINKKLLNVLKHDTDHLVAQVASDKLNNADSQALVNYLKVVKYLQKEQAEESENLTDDELKEIANSDQPSVSPEDSGEEGVS